jgi:hypothetical protein
MTTTDRVPCLNCEGDGRIRSGAPANSPYANEGYRCPTCDGKGYHSCAWCDERPAVTTHREPTATQCSPICRPCLTKLGVCAGCECNPVVEGDYLCVMCIDWQELELPEHEEQEHPGSTCGSDCGYCGRCS